MIKFFIKRFFDIPKSLYVSLRCFPLKKALKLPIIVSRKTKLGELHRNCIKIEQGRLCFTNDGTDFICSNRYGYFSVSKNSKIILKGNATFGAGGILFVDGGTLTIGKDFFMNKNGSIRCSNNITIGNNALIGWNVSIRDKEGHQVIENGIKKSPNGNITLGNHVWICAFVDIFKNSKISDNSIVAYKSLVNSEFNESNILIAGTPAKKIKSGYTWEH